MGDAAYERAATAEEIDRMCQLVERGHGGRRRRAVRPASRSPTAASTASRSRAGSPRWTRSRRCSWRWARPARGSSSPRPGWQCEYPDVFTWQPRVGRPFTCPLFALPDGKHLEVGPTARGGPRPGRQRLAAGHAASADHAVHPGRRLQPQRRRGVRRAHQGEPRGPQGRLPRSGMARAGLRGPGAGTTGHEAPLGDLRGLRVGAVPRTAGPPGDRHRPGARAPARST